MKKTLFTLLALVLISCNNEKPKVEEKPEITQEKVEVKKPNKFILKLEIKSSESDFISLSGNNLFLSNNRTINISLKEKVAKSDSYKTLILDWPENVEPDYSTSLNLGKIVKSIEVKSAHISYGDVEFEISPQEFKNYFTTSKYIDYNPETGILLTKKIDGKSIPILYIKKHIIDRLIS